MKTKKNPLEWTVFAVSLLLIAAVVTVLVLGAIRSTDGPADLRVTLGEPSVAGGGTWRVPLTVRNESDQTAEQAKIEVKLEQDGREVERAEVTIAFVPRNSSREGWAVFHRDPRCCEMTARPVGFEKP